MFPVRRYEPRFRFVDFGSRQFSTTSTAESEPTRGLNVESFSPSYLEHVVSHVFFLGERRDLLYAESNYSLARATRAAAHNYSRIIDDTLKPQWRCISKMLHNLQVSVQSNRPDKGKIISQLLGMRTGDSCMFFNRVQPAAVIFRKRERYTAYTSFKAPSNSLRQTLVCSYPEWAIEVPDEVFCDQHFLSELAEFLLYRDLSHSTTTDTRLLDCIMRGIGRNAGGPCITKRVHSHYGAESGHRSSLWLLIKIAIQISLDHNDLGRICYKNFMLHFMCSLAREAIDAGLSDYALHAISAKISRRLKKLGPSSPDWLSDIVLKTVVSLKQTLEARWEQVEATRSLPPSWTPFKLDLDNDTQLSLRSSGEYISGSLTNLGLKPLHPPFLPETLSRCTLNDFLALTSFEADSYHTLRDVEKAVEAEIDDWTANVTNVDQASIQLENLMNKYLSSALHTYRDNPEHISIMLLTVIELWVALDKLVVKEVSVTTDFFPRASLELQFTPVLCKTMDLHRLRRVYEYLSVRTPKSLPGCSIIETGKNVFSVRSHINSPDVVDSPYLRNYVEKYGSTIPPHVDLVVLELRCPVSLHIWRSATTCILRPLLGSSEPYGQEDVPFSIAGMQSYLVEHWKSPLSDRVYLTSIVPSGCQPWIALRGTSIGPLERKHFCYPSSPELELYVSAITHTSNDVLASQERCTDLLSPCEFIPFGHLRSGGSLQWVNVLLELRSRTLNFRRPDVYVLFAQTASQVGPFDRWSTEWVWHRELQDSSFCDILIDELDSFFRDVGVSSFDGIVMSTISLLLSCLLASSPCGDVSERAIDLLLQVRKKTFQWVLELSYNLMMEPTNMERSKLLQDMAATCRSTFDVGPAFVHKLLNAAEDVEALISCAIFACANSNINLEHATKYSKLLHERDRRLSLTLESVLRNVIDNDLSDQGIDLAIGNIWSGYRPGPCRWKPLPHPNSHWLTCETTAAEGAGRSQTVHLNLLNGALLVDGKSMDALPREIREQEIYKQIFGDKILLTLASDLPGMDLCTIGMVFEHRVHFALRDGGLVIRAQHKDVGDIVEAIPRERMEKDLPAAFIHGHIHWLNLSTSIIEIRPLKNLWEQSTQNWRIDCTSGQYRMYKGCECQVDIESLTWKLVSSRLGCLDFSENLTITTLPVKNSRSLLIRQLSVVLPRYGLSFFVNENGDLESCDFRDMVYDENQYIGTLLGLERLLVLRPKTQVEQELVHRCAIIPEGRLSYKQSDHRIDIDISAKTQLQVQYNVYTVDTDLGCLTGYTSLRSKVYLAHLHVFTSIDWRPDPLTGRTGVQEALHLLLSADCRSVITLDTVQHVVEYPHSHYYAMYPQIRFAIDEINYLIERAKSFPGLNKGALIPSDPPRQDVHKALQTAYLFPSEVTRSTPVPWIPLFSEQEDLAYTISLAVARWFAGMENEPGSWDHTELVDPLARTPGWVYTSIRPSIAEVDAILQQAIDTGQQLRLLFLLPTAVYRQAFEPQCHFLSILIALAKRENPSPHIGYRASYGYRPSLDAIWKCFHDAKNPHISILASQDKLTRTAVNQLSTAWPSKTPPEISLSADAYNLEQLNTELGILFSSCYLNFKLKDELTRCLRDQGSNCDIFPSPNRSPSCTSGSPEPLPCHTPGQVTLDQLFHDCSPPILPATSQLRPYVPGRNSAPLSSDLHSLNQLFASLRMSHTDPNLRQQYISRLHSSAQHARELIGTTYGSSRPSIEELRKHYQQSRDNYITGLNILKAELSPDLADPLAQALDRSGQWPQITPFTLLQCLASTSPIKLPYGWKKSLVSLALLLVGFQRARRLLRLALDNHTERLERELEIEGCEGWCAEERPDWLLIQIQGNFIIRPNQADIAYSMISPPSGQNTVMHVDIGEGKSSVILPISATSLADGNQLVRVVVPKVLTVQMFRLLVNRLGGLANRPIYHLPFSRSLSSGYSKQKHKLLREILSECVRNRGILVVQPEDVLSLKLAGVGSQFTQDVDLRGGAGLDSDSDSDSDSISSWRHIEDTTVRTLAQSRAFLKLQRWLYSHARDILDESDEVLHPGFHLMYTMGLQQHMEGYPDRWTIIQHVLALVKTRALSLSQDLPDAIECERSSSGSFPRIHILRSSDIRQRLISLIVDDVMDGYLPSINFHDVDRRLRAAIRSYISSKNVLQRTVCMVEEYARQSTLWNGILLLRGLLACNILLFALEERRWRVDYGLFPERTMLAVPYRAKDAPAQTAEFGHPDVMIMLTCLSYYYGGLTEEQLRTSFEILQEQDDPPMEYSKWLRDFDPGSVPEGIQDIKCINIKSSEQWDRHLFPLLSRNQGAVDLFLSRIVFPREAKEFPWKIAASSWDLAEIREHPTTGFSGTSDRRYLLPTSVTQLDLGHQRGSDTRILDHVLRSTNDAYAIIPNTNSERRSTPEFLRMIIDQEPEIRVLLDVGAQILDFSNRQLAKEWLELSSSSDGAVYFNEDDELMVLTRDDASRTLLSSPFAKRLDRCVVYLDDAHTRGTDLKFPSGFRAAVTLGPKVTKDRLIQGCMRMRKLGRGHSVMFFAPPEIDRSIRALVAKHDQDIPVNTTDILRWAIHETWAEIQYRAPYWAQEGISHHSRYDAWSRFCKDELTREELANTWLQPEHKSLAELYAPLLTENTARNLSILDDHPEIQQCCVDLGIVRVPEARMDEEQEREVSREIEHEREVETTSGAEPAEHFIHPDVVIFVRTGVIPPLCTGGGFRLIFEALEGSSAATNDAHFWSPFFLATADFCRTVKPTSHQGKADQYLRPVRWVLSGKKDNDRLLVLLSPFEANWLMPDIRAGEHVHLHVYTPRTSERMRPTDDLMFYSIPPVPDGWTPPWDLTNQLNLFAGQLYLRDYESYLWLRRFLGIHATPPPKNKSIDAAVRGNYQATSRDSGGIKNASQGSRLRSVAMLLAIRRRGLPFAETHLGRILQGQRITEKEFENQAWEKHTVSARLDVRTPPRTLNDISSEPPTLPRSVKRQADWSDMDSRGPEKRPRQ